MQSDDTIAAIASAVGPAARMIVRLSGGDAHAIASRISSNLSSPARLSRLRHRELDYHAWVYSFRATGSYTGEDTIEFHIPGNPLLARLLLDELIRLGARRADPGEFTARAYFNGRLDLSQVEGVAAIIAAGSDQELKAARQLLAGELAKRVKPTIDLVADTLALIEVGIDFSEEDVEFLSADQIRSRLEQIEKILDDLLRDSARLERLHHTPQFVLIGRPNAGKSTLLNALAGEHRAVVSPIAGTTRDALSADVALDRGMIRLIDVAGIDSHDDQNEMERQMHQRAMAMLQTADRVIKVCDGTDSAHVLETNRASDLVVVTKADLLPPSSCTQREGRAEGLKSEISNLRLQSPHPNPLPPVQERGQEAIVVSAHTGQNMPMLRRRLDELAFGTSTGSTLAINARHVEAIEEARAALSRASQRITDGAEVVALELREALDALGAVVGQITPDDVLGRIFSTFCIGK